MALQQAFGPALNIVLVSNETEAQLQKFIGGRKGFSLPIIVDEGNEWTSRFQPPSLPYTVIVKEGKVVAITEAEKLDKAFLQQWLNREAKANVRTEKTQNFTTGMTAANQQSSNKAVALSQAFLYAAKTGAALSDFIDSLQTFPYEGLVGTLKTDPQKKAFWLNLYNGFVQATLKDNPEQYRSRNAFFKQKTINVGGTLFSLDDIEHGILRRSKIKWSLGYLNKLFPSKKEKELRVHERTL